MPTLLIPDRPWAITQASYEQVLDVINREGLNLAAAREKREDHAVRAVELYGGKKMDGARYMTLRGGVAIIDVYGPIARRANLFSEISGGTSIDFLARDVQGALDNPAVQSILLVFDSPGGEVTGVSELAAAIVAGRDTKPINAYVDGMACSAGYWLASACSSITTNDTALLGSIGVVMALPDPTKSNIKEIEIVSSQSPNKRPDITTESGRGQVQTMLDSLADVFISAVAANRGVTAATVLADFGQGGVFVGQHAVAAGLADRVGSFEAILAGLMAQTQTTPMRSTTSRGATMTDQELQAQLVVSAPATEDPRITAMQAQLAAMRDEVIRTKADAFVSAQIKDRRILPAAADHLRETYVALATMDADAPTSVPRVNALSSFCAGLPPHTLTQEQVPTGATLALGNHTGAADTEEAKEARRLKLLNSSKLGRKAAAQGGK